MEHSLNCAAFLSWTQANRLSRVLDGLERMSRVSGISIHFLSFRTCSSNTLIDCRTNCGTSMMTLLKTNSFATVDSRGGQSSYRVRRSLAVEVGGILKPVDGVFTGRLFSTKTW